jgi:hypothetical protein
MLQYERVYESLNARSSYASVVDGGDDQFDYDRAKTT